MSVVKVVYLKLGKKTHTKTRRKKSHIITPQGHKKINHMSHHNTAHHIPHHITCQFRHIPFLSMLPSSSDPRCICSRATWLRDLSGSSRDLNNSPLLSEWFRVHTGIQFKRSMTFPWLFLGTFSIFHDPCKQKSHAHSVAPCSLFNNTFEYLVI